MRRWSLLLLPLLCACPASPEPEPERPEFPPALGDDLQHALALSSVEVGCPGAVLGVERADGARWLGAVGYADPATGRATETGDRFRIGSITKTFTAAVILQLVDEGDVHLDDVVEDYLPGLVPDGDRVTVRMLLQHRSGIPSYTDTTYFVVHLTDFTPPEEIVAVAVAEPPLFPPGEGWSYSNTNFHLLGLITEQVTGLAWHEAVRARLLDPLALGETYFEGPESRPGGIVRGHLDGVDVTDAIDTSWSWASGGLVSTTADLATWQRGLLDGEVLSDGGLEAMLTDAGTPSGAPAGYGLGVYLRTAEEGRYVGHTGSTQGFQSDLFSLEGETGSTADGAVVTALCNDFLSEASVVSAAAWDVLLAN